MKRFFIFLGAILVAIFSGCNNNELSVDMSKTATDTNAPPINLTTEIARAKTESKMVLLEFGSSDACPPCVLMQQKVFSSPEFLSYEKSNLDFVRLDYPLNHDLRPDTKATNILLVQQFNISPFPTFIALDKNGKEFWRQEGVTIQQFEPTNFIALLESVRQKEK